MKARAQKSSEKDLPAIHVRNLQRGLRVDTRALNDFARRALNASARLRRSGLRSPDFPDEIYVLLISDRRMASLHKKFLNQSGTTDVITFEHGEIFVSVPTAQRQAREFETSPREEIQLYIVHGLLHLLGFDDRTRAGARRMRVAESAVLARSGV